MQQRWFLFFISISLVGFTTAQSSEINSQNTSSKRNRTIDVQHIKLNLQFDFKKKQAYGTASITVSPLISSNTILLDAGMLSINSVVLKNGPILKFQYDSSDRNDNLLIHLNRSYSSGEKLTVVVSYHTNYVNVTDPNNLGGSYGKGLRFFSPTFTDPRKRKQIWSAGVPHSNRYWFPCYDGPDDFRTTELLATVDKNLTIISNGVLADKKQNADSTVSFHWKADEPYANHQTSIVIGDYVDLQQNFNGVAIHNYSYPDEVNAVIASTIRLTDMMRFFSEKIKTKYPYSTYNQIFVQEFPWGGGHNRNSSTLSDNMIDDEGTHADFLYLWDGVEGYDLAAQWFGNLLTPQSWEHAWLNKSFATYFSALYSEYKNGTDEFQLWIRSFHHNTYLADWYAGIQRPIVTRHNDNLLALTGDNYALYHGAEVLHMLRKQLGEEHWWKSIAYYVKTFANKTVTTEDFLTSIKAATCKNMSWFFDQWVYKMGHPLFEVTKKYNPAKGKLLLTIKQTQVKDTASVYPQSHYFKGWMDIAIDNRIERVWIEALKENFFSFSSTTEPKLVNVDFGNSWVKEMKFEKPLNELLYQFQNDKDVTGRNNAMLQLVVIAKKDGTAATDKQQIINAFYKVISGNSYWRFRSAALGQLRRILKPPYDEKIVTLVKSIIQKESSWLKTSAVSFLGTTNDASYIPLYTECLTDKSDRVIAAAALALANTKAPGIFEILLTLKDKPSWKNQSLMTALNAMKLLKDPRTIDIALAALKDSPPKPRWTLANNSWDYRVVAAEALAAFGEGRLGFPIVFERFEKSLEENDVNDIFNNVMLIAILGDARGQKVFDIVKLKFKDDTNAMAAAIQYEEQFKEAIKK
jgi:aminopeptidase N